MIPKIIHYAWFGSSIPEKIQLRVEKWKRIMPSWEFKLWNEGNYDLKRFEFSSCMYEKGKYGYVADELRYDVLNKFGGFYLDTDIIIKKDLSVFLNNDMVWGFLYDNSLATGIIGSKPNQRLLSDILEVYSGKKIFRNTQSNF
ncbi:glycosyltransferase family 32 protein [Paucilactobacillus hokkaidonensis]|uniref:glycosyltransferase family 32 protein n=1 Tax=Paucilactobacillus hokkaidonensis TaxID=1193095 RepID=UPI000AC469DE|nr:glycosyltransferase [Paucilactobacillus hokkaidonensis]